MYYFIYIIYGLLLFYCYVTSYKIKIMFLQNGFLVNSILYEVWLPILVWWDTFLLHCQKRKAGFQRIRYWKIKKKFGRRWIQFNFGKIDIIFFQTLNFVPNFITKRFSINFASFIDRRLINVRSNLCSKKHIVIIETLLKIIGECYR